MSAQSESLFNKPQAANQPLAERCRPRALKEVAGHVHVVGPQAPLRKQLDSGYLPSLIFWGPPGVGKTTIALLLAKEVDYRFESISAVSAGVRDVKEIIAQARQQADFYGKRTVLFIDEIHRFSKSQQDALLHAVEKGTLVLIGATTENPSFEVNAPLLSRCQVLKLDVLDAGHIRQIITRALRQDILLKAYKIDLAAEDALIHYGGGDARRTLNLLEIAFQMADKSGDTVRVDEELVKAAAAQSPIYYDKKGEYHYDTISAFIKSVRASDADAALYWLAVMIEGGEDPLFIARRLIILASEDVGNAEPYALMLATAGFDAVKNIGMPEGRIILSQVTTYLASLPKSNASYLAIKAAQQEVKQNGARPVPLHLRNAPTKLMKQLDYGSDYRYPHDFPDHIAGQSCLPEGLDAPAFYKPTAQGREARLKEYRQLVENRKKDMHAKRS